MEETVATVELYHFAREEYTRKLKEHYQRKLDEARAERAEGDDAAGQDGTGLRRTRSRTATETTDYNPQLYQINMDAIREDGTPGTGLGPRGGQHYAGGGFLGGMSNQ